MVFLIEEHDGLPIFARRLESELVEDVKMAVNARVKYRLRNPAEGVEKIEVYAVTVDPIREACRKWTTTESTITIPNGRPVSEVA